jgi:ketosteroid isomerase-like protein
MAHPNEDLVRRAYDAFSQGDIETLRQLFADDTIFHEPGRNPVSGDYQGIDQVLAFSGPSRSVLEGPSGSPCMMLWLATSMVSGCTPLRAGSRDRRRAGWAYSPRDVRLWRLAPRFGDAEHWE